MKTRYIYTLWLALVSIAYAMPSFAVTYYSTGNGYWNTAATWSPAVVPGVNDTVIIKNGHTITVNTDLLAGAGEITVEYGGILAISNGKKIDRKITVNGTITFPNSNNKVLIGKNAYIYIVGDADLGSIEFTDAYAGPESAKIQATGTLAITTIKATNPSRGGSLQASTITIATVEGGNNATRAVDLALHGPTTIAEYYKYGYLYFAGGDLTITDYSQNNDGPANEIISDDANSNLIINSIAEINQQSALITNIKGNIYFNGGLYNKATLSHIKANTIFIDISLKAEGNTDLYLEALVKQTGNLQIDNNNSGDIYIKKGFDGNGFVTDFQTQNAIFKVEGSMYIDNINNFNFNSSASIIVTEDFVLKNGNKTFDGLNGKIYVGGLLTLDNVKLEFNTGDKKVYLKEDNGNFYSSENGGEIDITTNSYNPIDQLTSTTIFESNQNQWLPIVLQSFTAQHEYGNVSLQWITASEINNDYFTLYRSYSGLDFTPIAYIAGAGNSSELISYSYIDENPQPGIVYYKLMQTDFNEARTQSHILAVVVEQSNAFVTYFSSSSGYSFIEYALPTITDTYTFSIYSLSGVLVHKSTVSGNLLQSATLALPQGVYTVHLQGAASAKSQIIVVKN